MSSTIAIYAGTFDPITAGHQNIIERTSKIFDHLYVCVATAHHKKTLFDLQERCAMIADCLCALSTGAKITIVPFTGLLIQTCRQLRANIIIRGLRSVADYEYERQLAAMNLHLAPEIETFFMLTAADLSFISSSMVREAALLGGDIDKLVAAHVALKLRAKIAAQDVVTDK